MIVTAISFVFSAVPLAFLKKDEPKKKSLMLPKDRSYYQALLWAAVMSFAMMITVPYAPLYAKERFALSGTMLGLLGSISAIGAVLLTYLADVCLIVPSYLGYPFGAASWERCFSSVIDGFVDSVFL